MTIYTDILNALNHDKDMIAGKTERLKWTLGELGESRHDCTVLAHGNNERFQVEWLYDMVWYKPVKTEDMVYENPGEFVLVLETELSKFNLQGFREDFDKLLIANAPFRVMIYSDRPSLCDEVLDYAEKAVFNCKNMRRGETVAVILYDDKNTGQYRMKLFTKN